MHVHVRPAEGASEPPLLILPSQPMHPTPAPTPVPPPPGPGPGLGLRACLQGHKNAVLEVHWFQDGETLLTCSSDKTVRAWDVEAGSQVKRLKEHTAIVNSVCPLRRGPQLFVSGADDGAVKVWDMRVKRSVGSFKDKFPVCAVAFADAGDQVYSAGVDNTIKVRALPPSMHPCVCASIHACVHPCVCASMRASMRASVCQTQPWIQEGKGR